MINDTVKKVQLTQEGLAELEAELQELKTVKLPAIVNRVAEARTHGDLKENAEYHAAKEEQSFIETRISEIEDVLSRVEVVAHTKSTDKVGIGSHVKVKAENKNEIKTFQIVGEYESDPTEGKISAASPLGKALIDKKKNEKIKFVAPGGTVEYTIIEIS